jgi:hypothetical protein
MPPPSKTHDLTILLRVGLLGTLHPLVQDALDTLSVRR